MSTETNNDNNNHVTLTIKTQKLFCLIYQSGATRRFIGPFSEGNLARQKAMLELKFGPLEIAELENVVVFTPAEIEAQREQFRPERCGA